MEVAPLDIPLRAPFGIAGGAQAAANNVLVTVELDDGTQGFGEAAPLPPYYGETQRDALEQLRAARAWLPGGDARAWREIGNEFRRGTPAISGAAQCALETALLDAVLRQQNIPMWEFFGGAGTELETDMTVTTGSVAAAAQAAAEIRLRGFRFIKVKIGGGELAHDIDRIAAVHAAAPESPLILDGNAGLTRNTAGELVRALKTRGIKPALLEQWLPKDDLAGMRALGADSGWIVAADESVSSVSDAHLIADAGAAHVLNIKLMKAGIAAALEIVAVARERGLRLMIGGNVESILGMTTSACFAAGIGGFQFADLDTPLFLATNPFTGGYELAAGRISVAHITAGHGCFPESHWESPHGYGRA